MLHDFVVTGIGVTIPELIRVIRETRTGMVKDNRQSITDQVEEVTKRLCRLDSIADPGALGVEVTVKDGKLPAFVVRQGGHVHGYINVCPHAGNPLNWKPDAFLTRDRTQIMCSKHGAVFEIETGLCTAGPCPGKKLRKLDVKVDGENVVHRTTRDS